IRAVAEDREMATIMGVNVRRVIAVTFFLGSALGGAGGVLVGLYYTQIDFFMGYSAGLKAFTAAVLGGIGNIRGAMPGGLILVVGFAGLLDLGYVAFFGIGSYLYAFLASTHFGLHLPFLLAVPIVVVLTAFSGILIGAPTLRLRGDYLAIVTLGFGEITYLLL